MSATTILCILLLSLYLLLAVFWIVRSISSKKNVPCVRSNTMRLV